jgi:hypothetical protein
MKIDIETIKTRSPYKDLFPRDKQLIQEMATQFELDGSNEAQPLIYQYIKNIGYVVVFGHDIFEAATIAGLSHINATRVDFEDEDKAMKYAREQYKTLRSKDQQTDSSTKERPIEGDLETEEEYIERRSRDYAKQIGDQLRQAGFESDQIRHVLSLVEL